MTRARFAFTRVSANRKTGPIPVTNTSANTCPDSCALKGAGCYAEIGPVAWRWRKLVPASAGYTLDELCALVRTIPGGSLWRHNVAGDLPGDNQTIDAPALRKLARANRGRRGFTYTHKPTTPDNVSAMHEATAAGFTINLSADNAARADSLAAHGLPVVVVVPADAPKVSTTPHGRKIVLCPAESSDRVTCANCGLCAVADRPYLIGFKPKGARKRIVNKLAKGEMHE
jgi:hypothetical protein